MSASDKRSALCALRVSSVNPLGGPAGGGGAGGVTGGGAGGGAGGVAGGGAGGVEGRGGSGRGGGGGGGGGGEDPPRLPKMARNTEFQKLMPIPCCAQRADAIPRAG